VLLAIVALASSCVRAAAPPPADEFVGPFPSWANAKADYGAAGDGKADDTDALQKALADLRQEKAPKKVLYLPAGTYRITRTLELARAAHNEATGTSLLGEDPATTVIRWDGAEGGVMLLYNPWYARMGRLTLDGAGKAATAVRHGPAFTTYNEFADMVIRDCGIGIEAGMKNGIAETAVLRCKFQRCSKAGASIQNFNSLDWWFWDCEFEGCRLGVTNQFGAGHFHVYRSLFRGSTEADMSIGNTEYFGIRGNLSVGSKAFFVAGGIGAGAQITFQGNIILDSTDTAAIRIGNLGPVVLMDNVIKSRADAPKGPAVVFAKGTAAISIGNTFTVSDPVKPGDRFHAIDDRIVPRGKVEDKAPDLPATPPNLKRPVFEVAAGAKGADIQKVIDEAAKVGDMRPVVHLPVGKYRVEKTLVVPAGKCIQLVGDGTLNGTVLEWAGEGPGPVIYLEGQSGAVLREMSVSGGKQADGIVLGGLKDSARVFGEQLNVSAVETGLTVTDGPYGQVLLHDFEHSGCKIGVKVDGGGQKYKAIRVLILGGASSSNGLSYDITRGGYLLARDIWYESGQEPRFMRCTDSGTFTLDGANVAHPHKKGEPGIEIDGFRGCLTFIGTTFTDVSSTPGEFPGIIVRGESPETNVLLLGPHGSGNYFANESAQAKVASLLGVRYTKGGGAEPIPDVGQWDDAFVRLMLRLARAGDPTLFPFLSERVPVEAELMTAKNDAYFHRVIVSGRNGVVIRGAK
jgi:hypothetical protein